MDAVDSMSEDQWNSMEEKYKAMVEALQSGLPVLQLKMETLQVSMDQSRLVHVILPTTTIITTSEIRIYPFLGAAVTLEKLEICA